MIAIMTDEGALEFGRSLSGDTRFLAWEAALLDISITDLGAALSLNSGDVDLAAMKIKDWAIVHTCACTGSLPVEVSSDNSGAISKAMAIDFDFNGQIPLEEGGASASIKYQTVIALGRRFAEYRTVLNGNSYNKGDHVWMAGDTVHDHAYICLEDGFVYSGVPLNEDSAHWMAIDTSSLITYPGNSSLYSDPRTDAVPFFVTSYDGPVTMANGMEWEYKVRVFLDNVATDNLQELKYFSTGGLEANGSVGLTFLAEISGLFRTIREKISTAS